MAGRGAINLAFRLALALALGTTALPAAEIGDAGNGATIWDDCAACHRIGPGAENAIGPKLNRIFGRRAASLPDFDYSKSLSRAGRDGVVWTLEALDAYIANPRTFASGTRMANPGLAHRSDTLTGDYGIAADIFG